MLTLVTGLPGTGKTAYVVSLLMKEVGQRMIFCDGIKELQLPHEKVPHIDEWVTISTTASGAEEYEWTAFPPGSLIVLDECQRFFRPRHVSKAVPAAVAGFETHRQAGLDFWLLTQDHTFLDANVRKLVDKHIHLQDSWIGKYSYTWLREGDPKSTAALAQAARAKYTVPAEAFPLYKSAELHTARKKPIPWAVPVVGVGLCVAAYLGHSIYQSRFADDSPKAEISNTKSNDNSKHVARNATTHWWIVGQINAPKFSLVITDGQRQRLVYPARFTRTGSDIEAELFDGTKLNSWDRNAEKPRNTLFGS